MKWLEVISGKLCQEDVCVKLTESIHSKISKTSIFDLHHVIYIVSECTDNFLELNQSSTILNVNLSL